MSKRLSVYQQLQQLHYSDGQILAAASVEFGTGSRGICQLAVAETEEDVIIGLTYRGDGQSEARYQDGSVAGALVDKKDPWRMKRGASHQVADFPGIPSLILSTDPILPEQTWGDDIMAHPLEGDWPLAHGALFGRHAQKFTYDDSYADDLAQVQERGTSMLSWDHMSDLKVRAKQLGIPKPYPRRKDDLIDLIEANKTYQSTALKPHIWPAWYRHDVMVLRADRGIVADTLRILRESARVDQLALGSGGLRLFRDSGLPLYDARDVGPLLLAQRRAHAKFIKEALKELEPVAAYLKERGHRWFALGNPSRLERDGVTETYYWLNGYGDGPGYSRQPFGHYTLADLRAERFVADVNNRAAP